MSKNSTNIKRTNVQAGSNVLDGPQAGLHKYQLPTVIEPISGITLEVRGLTNQSCMSTGPISAGDQNCIHVSTNDNARQYGWLTARFPQAADQCTRSCAVEKALRSLRDDPRGAESSTG